MPIEVIKKIEPAFVDKRGVISNILEKPISHVAIITSKAGSIRGNHYHPTQYQYVYLLSGKYESYSRDINEKNSKIVMNVINPGCLVITPPMVAHAMKFTNNSVMLNLTTGQRESDKFAEHTKKFKLI